VSLLSSHTQVFKVSDPAYAQSALSHAQELYALANLMPTNATYCAEVWCGGPGWTRYTSASIYDDLSLAASWLYIGTGRFTACIPRCSLQWLQFVTNCREAGYVFGFVYVWNAAFVRK
jgi:hypothetical protein